VFSTCFEHPSVHPQEVFYMQFYGVSFMHPKTACASLPEDEHLDVRNI